MVNPDGVTVKEQLEDAEFEIENLREENAELKQQLEASKKDAGEALDKVDFLRQWAVELKAKIEETLKSAKGGE